MTMSPAIYMQTVRTGISAAFWCDPAENHSYKKAKLPYVTRAHSDQTAWFDELFQDGGLQVPAPGSQRSITLLLTGPPGSGKSTLALELCYRLALGYNLTSRYFNTEGHVELLVKHARDFGWGEGTDFPIGEGPTDKVRVSSVRSKAEYDRLTSDEADGTGDDALRASERRSTAILGRFLDFLDNDPPAAVDPPASAGGARDIFVIDNLNTVVENKASWYRALESLEGNGVRLLIVILDAAPSGQTHQPWEYLADIVINLDRTYNGGYMLRTIEIVKSRYQQCVSGRHQFKILRREGAVPEGFLRTRRHPYRQEGGIFVYPSMHFLLSRHNNLHEPHYDGRLVTPFEVLNGLLGSGFPLGRCIALVGGRGTHKSTLAYTQLLHTLYEDEKSHASVISLGDDEEATFANLARIQHQRFRNRDPIERLRRAGRLEISYYPPGFITPDEFFHRMQLSVARQRAAAGTGRLLVVFNSLDFLSSHFPLCAEHKVFIPAMVELLAYQGVTSFFVAPVTEIEDHGLLSMADPILNFKRLREGDGGRLGDLPAGAGREDAIRLGLVKMEVERFAGGTSAGSGAYLLLVPPGHALEGPLGTGLQMFRPSATPTDSTPQTGKVQ